MGPEPLILVVDDVAMFRELETAFLARCGRIVTAASGFEALACAERERPDVAIVDSHLPDLTGAELCQRLGDVPVVMITGSGNTEDHAEAIRAGAVDVISKPIERSALVSAVRRLVQYPIPPGLPRVDVAAAVRIVSEDGACWGTARNVSRGGMFIEAHCDLDLKGEFSLEFRLPETRRRISPTGKLVWQRLQPGGRPDGFGLRFIDLDASSQRMLEDFVHERAVPAAPPSPALEVAS